MLGFNRSLVISYGLGSFVLSGLLLSGCVQKGDTVVNGGKMVTRPVAPDAGAPSSEDPSDESVADESDVDTSAQDTSEPEATTDDAEDTAVAEPSDEHTDSAGEGTSVEETSDGEPPVDETDAEETSSEDTDEVGTAEMSDDETAHAEEEPKCVLHEPVVLTDNASAKRGLAAATDGDVILASWQGLPAGVVKAQYVLADAELTPLSDGPEQIPDVEVTGTDGDTGYMEVAYSSNSQQFLLSWVNVSGSTAFPFAQFVDGEGALVGEPKTLGSFLSFTPGGRHRVSWQGDSFFFGYYWCASGGSGCPYPGSAADFNSAAWLLIDDETGVVTQPNDSGSPYPGAHSGTRLLGALPFIEAEAELEGFLGLQYNSANVGMHVYLLDGSTVAGPEFVTSSQSNANTNSKFAWDGQKVLLFSQGAGFGATAGQALRQERWDLAGNREYEKKLTTKALEPYGVHVDGTNVALLAGNDAALYYIQSTRDGEVTLEPEVIATGESIRNATLLEHDTGLVAVYLASVDGTDQVLATRIECNP